MEFFGLMAFFMVMMYIGVPKEQKALSRRVKQLEKINQGGKTNDSRFSSQEEHPYEILKVDEDWVQIRRNLKVKRRYVLSVFMISRNCVQSINRARDKSIYHFIKEKKIERGEYTPSVIIAMKVSQVFKESLENVFSLVSTEE
ncbi:XRE family transcriptional regulator [Streptococcus agalactiae CCUG 38383]|nr:XRE family transcriptional regulator [Streptococcus agalactiae CCUG 38383]